LVSHWPVCEKHGSQRRLPILVEVGAMERCLFLLPALLPDDGLVLLRLALVELYPDSSG
jgi:hypothetical protein